MHGDGLKRSCGAVARRAIGRGRQCASRRCTIAPAERSVGVVHDERNVIGIAIGR